MSILDKLFANKAKDVLDDIKNAELTFKVAEAKMQVLKSGCHAALLSEELRSLIVNYGMYKRSQGQFYAWQHPLDARDYSNHAESIFDDISEIIDEMEKRFK